MYARSGTRVVAQLAHRESGRHGRRNAGRAFFRPAFRQFLRWAEGEIKLSRVMGERTVRQHLESLWKSTGKKPAKLVAHGTCPEGFEPIWTIFRKLSERRPCGMAI